MRYLYLHGFASGPQSRKALAFRNALAAWNIPLEIPELDSGDFEHLTLSAQLQVVERTLAGAPARIAGSSMGGYLAAAFSFAERWGDILKPSQIEKWRESNGLDVYHYGSQTTRRVHYGLFEDALQYPPNPDFPQPALIFHGIHDTVVPIELSRAFAARHANAHLSELDSDHELLSVLPRIATEGVAFLTEGPA
jgi:pimeloyl-ACP methyl ester carboxylesterase